MIFTNGNFMMKILLLAMVLVTSSFAVAHVKLGQPNDVITDSLELGCGWSDLVYDDLSKRLSEKAKSAFDLSSKGPETTRRLYFFSDRSWFLTLEFFNSGSVEHDITCIVAHGPGETSEVALDYEVEKLPEWKWGRQNTFLGSGQ